MHRFILNTRFLFRRRHKVKNCFDLHRCLSSGGCLLQKDYFKSLEPAQTSDNLDLLLKSLRLATETEDVLSYVGKHHTIMNCSHIMQSLRSIFTLQKTENSDMSISEITKCHEFGILVNCLRSKARSLEVNDAIDAVKILSYLRISSSTKIMSILLQLIVKEINDLTLHQIIFLDFLIKDFQSTPLVEALKIALPIVFRANLKLKADTSNVLQLSDLLRYTTKRQMPADVVDFLVDLLIHQRQNFDLKSSIAIVRSVCEYKATEDSLRPLLHYALDTILDNEHYCSFAVLDSLLQILSNRFTQSQDYFYHEEFVQYVSTQIAKKNAGFEAGAWMLRKINKFGHVNSELLEYCAKKAEEEPWALESGRPSVVLSFVHGLALADLRPKNWSHLEPLVLANIGRKTDVELPWINILRDLATLGTWSKPLVSQIFTPEFLDRFLSRNYNSLDYLQLLSLHHAVKALFPQYSGPFPNEELLQKAATYNGSNVEDFPVAGALSRGLGDDSYFLSGAYTKHGFFIDHLIVVNGHGSPVTLDTPGTDRRFYAEDLMGPGRTLVGIIMLPTSAYCSNVERLRGPIRLGLDALEATGVIPLPISSTSWALMPDRERIPWLMRALAEKCPSLSVCNYS